MALCGLCIELDERSRACSFSITFAIGGVDGSAGGISALRFKKNKFHFSISTLFLNNIAFAGRF